MSCRLVICLAILLWAIGCFSPRYRVPPAGVLFGERTLTKRKVLTAFDVGGVSDITAWPSRSAAPRQVIVAGTSGAVFLEPGTYRRQRACRYRTHDAAFVRHDVVDSDGDGVPEFFRYPTPWTPATLFAADGRRLWAEPSASRGLPVVGYDDADGDGRLEFYLGSDTLDDVLVLDDRGDELRRGDWSDRAMEGVRVERRAHARTSGQKFRALSTGPDDPSHIVRVWELREQAAVAGIAATRLRLQVIDPRDRVIYDEVIASIEGELARGGGALAIVPARQRDSARFLVGYGPEVWEYELLSR